MRCLRRNQSRFYYALFIEKKPVKDECGNDTSEYEVVYGNPVECRANISASRGETATRQFGDDEVYDKVIVMDNPKAPIDEYSVLWIDRTPQLTETGELEKNESGEIVTPWDYEVRKVARSLNSVQYAIRKVDIRG